MTSNTRTMNQFANHTLSFLSQLVGIDTMAFYTVDPGTDSAEFELFNVPSRFFKDYNSYGKDIDPFATPRAAHYPGAMALVSNHLGQTERDKEFAAFLTAHGFVDTLEVFFKPEGTLVAGISILITDHWNDPIKRTELFQRCKIAQPYLEFSVGTLQGRPAAVRVSDWLNYDIGLSNREIEVTRLVAEGKCNKRIASDLSITVATVKTHLVRVFDKAGVNSRAELIAKINY
jgi:DNA-binding CsgD family transcriptional regulator